MTKAQTERIRTWASVAGVVITVASILVAAGVLKAQISSTKEDLKAFKAAAALRSEVELTNTRIEQKLDIYINQNTKDHEHISQSLEKIDSKVDLLIRSDKRTAFLDGYLVPPYTKTEDTR